jgi:hypothetical protein
MKPRTKARFATRPAPPCTIKPGSAFLLTIPILEVRRDWAQYYDNINTMDKQVQARLDELNDGSAETIVFSW